MSMLIRAALWCFVVIMATTYVFRLVGPENTKLRHTVVFIGASLACLVIVAYARAWTKSIYYRKWPEDAESKLAKDITLGRDDSPPPDCNL